MDRHFIVEKESLTAIADELRAKGEVTKTIQLPLVRKSANVENINDWPTTQLPSMKSENFTEMIRIEGASQIRVRGHVNAPNYLDAQGNRVGSFWVDNDHYGRASATGTEATFDVTYNTNLINIGFNLNYLTQNPTSAIELEFFYVEFYGIDAEGNQMSSFEKTVVSGTDATFTMAEMAEAVSALDKHQLGDISITTNGSHNVAGYRNAVVNIPNTPAGYVEATVAADIDTSLSFDLSQYILDDNMIFSLAFTMHTSTTGSGVKMYDTYLYEHNPAIKDEVLNIISWPYPYYSSKESNLGISEWLPNLTYNPNQRRFHGVLQDGIFTVREVDENNEMTPTDRVFGRNAVLRYLV